MNNPENQTSNKSAYEHVEAIPGPAIIISKETYKKMQENNSAKQNRERLEKMESFFKSIKNETKQLDNTDLLP